MDYTKKVAQTIKNIKTAINDYWKHTNIYYSIKEDISHNFIETLAKKSVTSKESLRAMLRNHPAWNEELDAVVINGTTTHNPDYNRIRNLARDILSHAANGDNNKDIISAVTFFATKPGELENQSYYTDAINRLAPDAWAQGKKKSRVFKALCVGLGIADETPNSEFQRNFAKIADEMSSRQIDFKLFLSINPAHFITMSNPKGDSRGSCLTSCHSFNSTDHDYNNGCSGYAMDDITMIAFTASDPSNPETLNNRKTTRQLFMYKPNSGVLLQSRMYNTSGGTYGAQEESKLYRSLVQSVIAYCENATNYWYSSKYIDNNKDVIFRKNINFGGYPDWEYSDYEITLSIRTDHAENYEKDFYIGNTGLCISCSCPTSESIYCYTCKEDTFTCECCDESFPESEQYAAFDRWGDRVEVCENCLRQHYTNCDDCGEYHELTYTVQDKHGFERTVCESCRDEYYSQCKACNKYYPNDVIKTGLCPECIEEYYENDIA